jgi:hypothetical protein
MTRWNGSGALDLIVAIVFSVMSASGSSSPLSSAGEFGCRKGAIRRRDGARDGVPDHERRPLRAQSRATASGQAQSELA